MRRLSASTIAAGLLAAGFGGFVARLPLWVSSDSVAYVAMARSLRAAGRLELWNGGPCAWWPPGYSAVISLGAPPLGRVPDWLPFFNGLLAACLAATAWRITRRVPVLPRALLIAALLLSASTLSVLRAYLSDGLFLCLWLGFCLALRRERMPWWGFLLAAALPLVRSVGLVAWPALALHLAARDRSWRSGLRAVAVAVPFGLWCLRNRLIFGELLPNYPGQARPFDATLRRSFEVLAESWVPRVTSTDLLLASFALLVLALLAFAGHRRPRRLQTAALLLLPAAFLFVFLAGSATRLVDRPDPRLLAPLFASLWVLVVLAVECGWPRRGPRIRALLCLGLSMAVVASARLGVREWGDRIVAADVERRSLVANDPLALEIQRQVQTLADSPEPLATNVPGRVYWLTGRPATWSSLLAEPDEYREMPSRLYLREEFLRPFLVDIHEFAANPGEHGYVETSEHVYERKRE